MFKKITILLSASLLWASVSQATILFSPSISYLEQSQQNGTNPQSNAKLTLIDLRLGYVMDFGLYLGGLYSLHDSELFSATSDSYFGPSVGYYNSGFLAVFTYYLYGERDQSSGASKFADVNGYQLDISYSIPLTPTIAIGPQLTYHSVEFNEEQVSGIAQAADYKWSGISPYFNITFMF